MPFTDAMQCNADDDRGSVNARQKEKRNLSALHFTTAHTHKVRRACTCSAVQGRFNSFREKDENVQQQQVEPSAHTHTTRDGSHARRYTFTKNIGTLKHITHTHTVQFNSNSFRLGLAFSHLAPLIDQGKRKRRLF